MKNWIIPEFKELTKDVELFAEWKRLHRRFGVTEKNIQAGWIVNIRETPMLDNMLSSAMCLTGVGHKFKNRPEYFESSSQGDSIMWNTSHKGSYNKNREFQDTLIGYHHSLQLNGKTIAFIKKLENADRFTQHCILSNKEWCYDTWDNWMESIIDDRYLDDLMESEYGSVY